MSGCPNQPKFGQLSTAPVWSVFPVAARPSPTLIGFAGPWHWLE